MGHLPHQTLNYTTPGDMSILNEIKVDDMPFLFILNGELMGKTRSTCMNTNLQSRNRVRANDTPALAVTSDGRSS